MEIFQAEVLRDYCRRVMTAAGVEAGCAETVADVLVDADLTGVSTHGVSRMAIYLQRIQSGAVSRDNNIRILRESPSALAIAAGHPGAELAVGYADNNGDTVSAQWLLE